MHVLDKIQRLQSPIISTSDLPTELEYAEQYSINCYTVCWNSLGNLLAGGEVLSLHFEAEKNPAGFSATKCIPPPGQRRRYLTREEKYSSVAELLSSWVDASKPIGYVSCSQTEHAQSGYVLRFYSLDLESGPVVESMRQQPMYSHGAPAFGQKLAVLPLALHIVVSNHLKKRFDIFNDKGQFMFFVKTQPGSCATGLHCLPDGSIIASFETLRGIVSYTLDIPGQKLNANWTCGDLDEPTGVSSDSAGYIYVGSRGAECIYIISSEGECLIEENYINDTLITSLCMHTKSLNCFALHGL